MPKSLKSKSASAPLARIAVVGVGGGGGNAVSRMSRDFVRGVEFIAINTDHQDLDHATVHRRIYIGRNLTRGLGTGMNPDLGRQAAEENRSEIAEALKDADLVFISAGFGGGTGTGASPVIAEVAKQSGALTIAVVTRPFAFEGSQRERIAQEGLAKLKDKVDAMIVVPNDRIFSVISKDTPIMKAFQAIDDVLRNALRGIVELIISPGLINVDFADVRTIIQDAGSAIVGVGIAAGPDRAVKAVDAALHSALLEVSAEGAHGVLLGISGGRDLRMTEINDAAKLVAQTVDPAAKIIFGAYHDKSLHQNQIKITLIATGFAVAATAGGAGNSLFGTRAFENGKSSFFSGLKNGDDTRDEDGRKIISPSRDVSEKSHPSPSLTSPVRSVSADFLQESLREGERTAPSSAAKRDIGVSKSEVKKDTEEDPWAVPSFLRRKKH